MAATKSRFLGLRHEYSLRFVALGNYFPLKFDDETYVCWVLVKYLRSDLSDVDGTSSVFGIGRDCHCQR